MLNLIIWNKTVWHLTQCIAVEYTYCTSVEEKDLSNGCPGYDTKQSDGKVPVMLGFCGIRSTSSLQLLPGHTGPAW